MDWIFDMVNTDSKAELLKTVDDSSAIVDNTSVLGKIFNSFLYNFGKNVAINCQSPPNWKSYFSQCFELLWKLFPNWQIMDESQGLSTKSTVKAYARDRARINCRNRLKKMNRFVL